MADSTQMTMISKVERSSASPSRQCFPRARFFGNAAGALSPMASVSPWLERSVAIVVVLAMLAPWIDPQATIDRRNAGVLALYGFALFWILRLWLRFATTAKVEVGPYRDSFPSTWRFLAVGFLIMAPLFTFAASGAVLTAVQGAGATPAMRIAAFEALVEYRDATTFVTTFDPSNTIEWKDATDVGTQNDGDPIGSERLNIYRRHAEAFAQAHLEMCYSADRTAVTIREKLAAVNAPFYLLSPWDVDEIDQTHAAWLKKCEEISQSFLQYLEELDPNSSFESIKPRNLEVSAESRTDEISGIIGHMISLDQLHERPGFADVSVPLLSKELSFQGFIGIFSCFSISILLKILYAGLYFSHSRFLVTGIFVWLIFWPIFILEQPHLSTDLELGAEDEPNVLPRPPFFDETSSFWDYFFFLVFFYFPQFITLLIPRLRQDGYFFLGLWTVLHSLVFLLLILGPALIDSQIEFTHRIQIFFVTFLILFVITEGFCIYLYRRQGRQG